jgi:hypothetical protein
LIVDRVNDVKLTVDRVRALARAGDEVLKQFSSDVPDELFHYTDAAGLIGILANKGELWASDARCMNDTRELEHGNELLRQALRENETHPMPLPISPAADPICGRKCLICCR